MDAWFVLVPVALTSAAVALVRWRRHGAGGRALVVAAGQAMETVGLTVLFFLANLGTGALVTALARALDLAFISIYLTADVALLVLSVLQALVYQRWRDTPTRER